jgi:type IV pilus biogenesis protein CpaD/CtpE
MAPVRLREPKPYHKPKEHDMRILAVILLALVAGCAGVTPAGQALNKAREVAKPIIAKQLDTSADTSRTFVCDDLPYKAEMRARNRWNVTDAHWNGFCGRRGGGR